jgi:hypothetical protein
MQNIRLRPSVFLLDQKETFCAIIKEDIVKTLLRR